MLLGLVLGVCTTAMVVARIRCISCVRDGAAPIVGITFKRRGRATSSSEVRQASALSSCCLQCAPRGLPSLGRWRPLWLSSCTCSWSHCKLDATDHGIRPEHAKCALLRDRRSSRTRTSPRQTCMSAGTQHNCPRGRRSTSTPSSMDSAFAVVALRSWPKVQCSCNDLHGHGPRHASEGSRFCRCVYVRRLPSAQRDLWSLKGKIAGRSNPR